MYIIYSKEGCINCERAKALLLSKRIEYKEFRIDLEENVESLERLKEMGVRQLPYIEFEDEDWWRKVGGLEELKPELF
jgi:glutaredoxin